MQLLELPSELLHLIPFYLHSVDDLFSLLRTCHVFFAVCCKHPAKVPVSIAPLYGQRALPPHPHLLLYGTARQLADWAVESSANREALLSSIERGNEGLVKLAERVAQWSLSDVRSLHALRSDVLVPIAKKLDVQIGPASREARSVFTVCEEVETALLNYLIHCELFHHSIEKSHQPDNEDLKPLSIYHRLQWTSQCVPDANNDFLQQGAPGYPLQDPPEHTRGKYEVLDLCEMWRETVPWNHDDLHIIQQLLSVIHFPEDDYYKEPPLSSKKCQLFAQIMTHQGLDTLRFWHTKEDPETRRAFRAKAVEIAKAVKNCSEEWVKKNVPDYDGGDADDFDEDARVILLKTFTENAKEKTYWRGFNADFSSIVCFRREFFEDMMDDSEARIES